MLERVAYTDGACSGGLYGGWAVWMDGEMYSGWAVHTTNNLMELFAIFNALLECERNCKLKVVTDSKLSIGLLTGRFGTEKSHLQEVLRSCWTLMLEKHILLSFEHVKGHAGHPENHRVDREAVLQTRIARNAVASTATVGG